MLTPPMLPDEPTISLLWALEIDKRAFRGKMLTKGRMLHGTDGLLSRLHASKESSLVTSVEA